MPMRRAHANARVHACHAGAHKPVQASTSLPVPCKHLHRPRSCSPRAPAPPVRSCINPAAAPSAPAPHARSRIGPAAPAPTHLRHEARHHLEVPLAGAPAQHQVVARLVHAAAARHVALVGFEHDLAAVAQGGEEGGEKSRRGVTVGPEPPAQFVVPVQPCCEPTSQRASKGATKAAAAGPSVQAEPPSPSTAERTCSTSVSTSANERRPPSAANSANALSTAAAPAQRRRRRPQRQRAARGRGSGPTRARAGRRQRRALGAGQAR